MYLPELTLHEPRSLQDLSDLLQQLGPQARLMAGGTDLLVDLKTGRIPAAKPEQLICLAKIPGLRGTQPSPATEGGIRIGALTTIGDLQSSPALTGPYRALRDAAAQMAAAQVRNLATIGGNVAGGVPCADLPPVLQVLSASVVLWSAQRQREIPLDEFHLGPRQTALQPGELLTHIDIPHPAPRTGAAYERFGLRNGNAIAVAGVAAALTLDAHGNIASARIALNAAAPMPRLIPNADAILAHRPLEEGLDAAADTAAAAADPISDLRASADYRRELVRVLTRRALQTAHTRALEAPQ